MKGCRNVRRGWEELKIFEKVWARAPGPKNGPQKIFKVLNFENVEIFRNSLVPP